jgi:hypothetical protein
MTVDGIPVCELCDDFINDHSVVFTFEGKSFHWSCLYVCHDCGREFVEGQPKKLIENEHDVGYRWVHELDQDCIPL